MPNENDGQTASGMISDAWIEAMYPAIARRMATMMRMDFTAFVAAEFTPEQAFEMVRDAYVAREVARLGKK